MFSQVSSEKILNLNEGVLRIPHKGNQWFPLWGIRVLENGFKPFSRTRWLSIEKL